MSFKTLTLAEVWDKHHDCEVVIYHRQFRNGELVPGLYCKKYGIWIQWLDPAQAAEYISLGVEVVTTQPKKRYGHPVKWISMKELGI